MKKFNGIFPALLTPFNKENKIDEKMLEKLILWNLEKGVTGFYVGGSTAEAFLLSHDERKKVYKIVKDVTENKCTLIAHVGAISTYEAIDFGMSAKELGYDAISAVAPFYFKFSVEEIKKYYFDIVDHVHMPMIVYNIPAFSGVSMGMSDFKEIFKKEQFIGLKHTSSDFFALEQFKTSFPDKIAFNGYDEMYMAGLAMGADGGIGSTYNFMSEKFIKITQLFKENKIEEARKVQNNVNKIISLLIKVGVMQGEKEVLRNLGMDFGQCRAPFAPLSDEGKRIVADEIMPLL